MVFMHKLGLVHLDLKLENILLDDQYNAIVSDFGFSTFCDSSTDRCLK